MIQLYWRNVTSDVIGDQHGITQGDLMALGDRMAAARQAVTEHGSLGYVALPTRRDYRDSAMAMVNKHKARCTDLVVLGIGGSALGNIALQGALNGATYNLLSDAKRGGPRLFVLDNVDPAAIKETLALLGRRLQ
ncbi:MAG: glucose-6-phosphate isomerase, partial [Planctomycetes bacterium]|nr:glucose-6-phosphate isomerase [Planctomycetota bacterium]